MSTITTNQVLKDSFIDLKNWYTESDEFGGKLLKGFAAAPLHLFNGVILGPALIIYDLAMTFFWGLIRWSPDASINFRAHLSSIVSAPYYLGVHLLAVTLPYVAYKFDGDFSINFTDHDLPTSNIIAPLPLDTSSILNIAYSMRGSFNVFGNDVLRAARQLDKTVSFRA